MKGLVLSLSERELAEVRRLLKDTGRAWLFGSRVWGSPGPFADLDVALEDPPPLAEGGIGGLKERFDESDLPFVVDLSVLHELPREWQEKILAEGIEI